MNKKIINDLVYSYKFHEKQSILDVYKFLKERKYEQASKSLQQAQVYARLSKDLINIKKKIK